jgi:hypothetical protein
MERRKAKVKAGDENNQKYVNLDHESIDPGFGLFNPFGYHHGSLLILPT